MHGQKKLPHQDNIEGFQEHGKEFHRQMLKSRRKVTAQCCLIIAMDIMLLSTSSNGHG
jgi:hypothetical protein